MTDFLESVRPMESVPFVDTVPAVEAVPLADEVPSEPTVRELLAELAHLEDVLRAAGHGDGEVDEGQAAAEVLAAMAREQVIIDELHRRTT